mgnify:CR=1 FL=1
MVDTSKPFAGDKHLVGKPEQQSANALIYIAAVLFDIKQELVKLNVARNQGNASDGT